MSYCEPAYAAALDWLLCDGLERLLDRDGGESLYLRLSTRPLDQSTFADARERLGEEALRADVLAGGYRLVEAQGQGPPVTLLASGAVMPEVLEASAVLQREGVAVNVIDATSPDRLYRSWRDSLDRSVGSGTYPSASHHLARLLPPEQRRAPIVTVHDAASHAMAWVGSALGTTVVPLGVDGFGQSGTVEDLYGAHHLNAESIVNAALVALGTSAAG